jgi:hypothetical protein
MQFKPRSYNVLFVTVDSCRFDVARKATLPFLNKIATLRKAEAPASYTLPSHMSFFIGILPILKDGDKNYLPGIEQIWRSTSAKKRNKAVAVQFNNKTIIDYYIENNYIVAGAGGVSFFSNSKNNILPNLFPKFLYFEKPKGLPSYMNVPRSIDQFPLGNIEKLVKLLNKKDPFFLFINCPETHVPFDSPDVQVSNEYKKTIKHYYAIDCIKYKKVSSNLRMTQNEREILLSAQRKSLEWIDKRLKLLLDKIPDNNLPTLLLVVSDHGEEFGEGGRYGHAHIHKTITEVPLWCTILNCNEHRI